MASPPLPSFDELLAEMAAAERRDGWLIECQQRGWYLALNRQLISALSASLRCLADSPVLEVCAGDGRLAAALTTAGVPVIATDADPATTTRVEGISARDALLRFRPTAVVGSFVPLDAGVDQDVLRAASVQFYLVLNARIGGAFGSPALWQTPGWRAQRRDDIARWMITRHDVWVAGHATPLIQHGEAWLMGRESPCRARS